MRTSIALILTSRRTLYFLYIRRHFEYFDKFNHHASWFCLKLNENIVVHYKVGVFPWYQSI